MQVCKIGKSYIYIIPIAAAGFLAVPHGDVVGVEADSRLGPHVSCTRHGRMPIAEKRGPACGDGYEVSRGQISHTPDMQRQFHDVYASCWMSSECGKFRAHATQLTGHQDVPAHTYEE